jgi:hypothetical protein
MNAVFIAGIEVRLALKSRSDALPVCRLGIGRAPGLASASPITGPRATCRPPAPRSPKDAHAPSSHRARSSEPLRALSCTHRRCRTLRRRKLHAPSFPAASQRRCRTYRLSQRRLACRPICGIGSVGKPGYNGSTMTATEIAAQKVVGPVCFPTRRSELPLLRPSRHTCPARARSSITRSSGSRL